MLYMNGRVCMTIFVMLCMNRRVCMAVFVMLCRYQRLLRRARTEDMSDMARLRALYTSGRDRAVSCCCQNTRRAPEYATPVHGSVLSGLTLKSAALLYNAGFAQVMESLENV